MNHTASHTLNYQINNNNDHLKVNDWRLNFLCDYIETNHHEYIRKIMPKILSVSKALSRKNIIGIDDYKDLLQFSIELEIHIQKEERLLFPYIKKMNTTYDNKDEYEVPPFGSIANLIKVIEKEHKNVSGILLKVKNAYGNFKIKLTDEPDKKVFYELMNEFYSDFQMHVHLENDILFPKSISLEKKLRKIFLKTK
ncbi:MAG: hemerythrin domain-containing protein [Ignavibacteria bacterium]|nr:hemerythrin domain-containing protein [Ignavibacteria bacterium]